MFGLAPGFGCRFAGIGCRRIWIGWLRRRGGGMRLPMQLGSRDVLELSEREYGWGGLSYCVDGKVTSGVEEGCHVESITLD